MKTYKVYYQRIEDCVVEINADSKKEAKQTWIDQDYDLENEKVNEIFHKFKSAEEVKETK
jgi:hypothetical protein